MIYILLPAYNEEQALKGLIPDLAAVLQATGESFQIVVVNDGSRDGTSAYLAACPPENKVREVKHSVNRGYGAALRTGYEAILSGDSSEDSVVVSLDADGTHGPEFIPRLIEKVRSGFDVVTASYSMPGASYTGIPAYRALLSRTVNLLFRLACPIPGAATYSNGFRAYRLGILRKVQSNFKETMIEDTGFSGGAELFLKAAACGARVSEAPFDLHYERRGKDSKIRFLPTIIGYLKLVRRSRRF